MKKEIYYCDICGAEKEESSLHRLRFVNDKLLGENTDISKVDICQDCIESFKNYLKAIRSPLFYGNS